MAGCRERSLAVQHSDVSNGGDAGDRLRHGVAPRALASRIAVPARAQSASTVSRPSHVATPTETCCEMYPPGLGCMGSSPTALRSFSAVASACVGLVVGISSTNSSSPLRTSTS